MPICRTPLPLAKMQIFWFIVMYVWPINWVWLTPANVAISGVFFVTVRVNLPFCPIFITIIHFGTVSL